MILRAESDVQLYNYSVLFISEINCLLCDVRTGVLYCTLLICSLDSPGSSD